MTPIRVAELAIAYALMAVPKIDHGALVVLIGQRKAVAIAVHGVSGRRRWSKLREWLRGGTHQVVDRDIRPNRK